MAQAQRTIALFLAPALAMGLLLAGGQFTAGAQNGVNGVLLASPDIGHSGDPLTLSGTGLQPNSQYSIFWTCPAFNDPTVALYHNYGLEPGPTTNSSGGFTGFVLKSPIALHGIRSSGCIIYVHSSSDPNVGFVGPDVPALYYVYAPETPIPRCEQRICGTVVPRPTRQRAGSVEDIAIRCTLRNGSVGWGGTRADIAVTYPHARPKGYTIRLDWRGQGHLSVRIPPGISESSVHVDVRFRLGQYRGKSSGEFAVVH